MRRVDKRKWVCTNIQGECLLSQTTGAALCQEVPADRKCPLCQSEITILAGEPETPRSLIEVMLDWVCEICGKSGLMEEGDMAPEICPKCGGQVSKPLIKKDEPFDGLEKRY